MGYMIVYLGPYAFFFRDDDNVRIEARSRVSLYRKVDEISNVIRSNVMYPEHCKRRNVL